MNKKIAFFDLDGTLLDNDYEVWIIHKDRPSKPIMVLNPIDFALIKKGHYVKDDICLDYNGQRYYISEELSKKLQKRARTENIENFGISHMPMISRESEKSELCPSLNKSEYEFLLKNIEHLRFDKHTDIGILTARSNQGANTDTLNKLRLELKNIGITIHKIYFVGESVYKGQNYVKKMNILLEHLVGFKIKNGRFISIKQDWYPTISFYDDDPQNINYANDIQTFFEEIIRKTDDEIFHIIMERINEVKPKLINYLVTSNDINRFVETSVMLQKPVRFPIRENYKMKYLKEFK